MKTQLLNCHLGCFMQEFIIPERDRFPFYPYNKVGCKIWDTGTAGSKKLTKYEIRRLEKTGLVQFDWTDTAITIKSHVNIISVKYHGEGPPYKNMIIEYTE